MDYINKEQLNNMLKENELENVHYHKVQAAYTYQLTDVTTNENIEQTNLQAMYKIKKDGEDRFIMMDVYKDYEPFYLVLKREDLAKKEFTVMSTNLFSLEEEAERIDQILAKKVGGPFDKKWDNKFHVFAQDFKLDTEIGVFAQNLRDEHLEKFEKQLVTRLTEISELKTGIKNDSMEAFSDIVDNVIANKIEKSTSSLSKLSDTFDNNLETKLVEMKAIYNETLEQKEQERHSSLEAESKARFEQAKVQEMLAVQSARADVIEQFGYYPVLTKSIYSDLNLIIHDKKGDVLDTFKIETNVHEVDVGHYDRDGDNVPELLIEVPHKSIDSIHDKKREQYFHAFYVLENSIGFENKKQVDLVSDKFDFTEKDFSYFTNDENSLTKEMSKEFKNEQSLKYANEMLEEFQESIKKPKNKMKP